MFGDMPAFGTNGVEPLLTVIAVSRATFLTGAREPVGSLPTTI